MRIAANTSVSNLMESKNMNLLSVSRIAALATALLTSAVAPLAAQPVERAAAIRGEITHIDDALNWFHDSIQLGMTVEGAYNFFETGYQRGFDVNDPSEITYRYFFAPNGFNVPPLPVSMRLTLGGHDYRTGPSPFIYGIRINDGSSGFINGDAYRVQSPLPFPSNFTDWTGDPVNDPDGNFLPILGMSLELLDSSGTALASTDLPLIPPDLAKFTTARGRIFIEDGNGEPGYAVAEFRITSLRLVPEPSGLLIACFGALGLLPFVARRRQVGCK